jgi:hypothetical protein
MKGKENQKKRKETLPDDLYLEVRVRRAAEVVDDLLQRLEPCDAQRVAVARRRVERASDQVAQFGDKVPVVRRDRGFETELSPNYRRKRQLTIKGNAAYY